ncbi:7-carboxy-7-deazaguanine synthase QueE [Bryobacter aggregatus]|uniref:7-carboxy-7-deazaguanine synthase QueE n=1 Tax=Bryobacter aggregatus TaxID=360054 RepID=UPI0004E18343|nr:7-carboxy-7-deazaguanine synthase QueE [Bryobacter aggregatus]
MKISEIFYSIQGEGGLAGVASVFVRSSGCNLRCVWCDTPYTSWKPEGTEQSIDQIVDQVRSFPARHVVLTGGEPMLFEESIALCQRFRDLGLHITIETAGTVFRPVPCDLMSISPKLANSTPVADEFWASRHDKLRLQPEVLRKLMEHSDYQLKFVVAQPSDLEEIQPLVQALSAIPEKVLLMPEGRDAATLQQRSYWIVEACKTHGYRYSPRLHVQLWGDLRGV